MRTVQAWMICGSILLSGCWTSFRYRADVDQACAGQKLKNAYCITKVAFCPFPLEAGVPESVYENQRVAMERTLCELYPELFRPAGTQIMVSMRSVSSESDSNVPLVCLNALLSLFTLGTVPVAGGFSNDFIVSVDPCGEANTRKFRLRAENFSSMGIVPTALLRSYSADDAVGLSVVGKSGLAERDRQVEILMAKAFGESIVQLLMSYETMPKAQTTGVREGPKEVRENSQQGKTDPSKASVIEVDQIPL